MRKKIYSMMGAMLLALTFSACHEESDVVLAYAYQDVLPFNEAEKSYAGKFRVFWKAMNTNYTLWDYEKECGLDWDEHYQTMLPKFEALDQPGVQVTDSMLEALMKEMAAPLHDGHMSIEFKNHQTGRYVDVAPSIARFEKRPDAGEAVRFTCSLSAYTSQFSEWKEANTSFAAQLKYILSTPDIGLKWAEARYEALKGKTDPTHADANEMVGLNAFIEDMKKIAKQKATKGTVTQFNEIVLKYDYLNIPFLDPIDLAYENAGINLKYFLTNDGIAYLYLSDFALSPYLADDFYQETFSNATPHTKAQVARVKDVWQSWFGSIQRLHKAGTLKGVIIDVRGNGGGKVNDGRYVIGSLLPKGDIQYGWARMKRGVGRYDFSPIVPMMSYTMEEDHEVIDDVPVAVLADGLSTSMSEMTSLTCKRMPNGRVIGRRTYGGLCALDDNSTFSENYSGHIGVSGETPVYVYLPSIAILDYDKHFLEGIGVEPDIEVGLDIDEKILTGRDTQLERALEYVRTGK